VDGFMRIHLKMKISKNKLTWYQWYQWACGDNCHLDDFPCNLHFPMKWGCKWKDVHVSLCSGMLWVERIL
jgi:hypothetical protein